MYPNDAFFVSYIEETDIKPRIANPEKEDQLLNRLILKVTSNIYSTVEFRSEFSNAESTENGYSEKFDSYTKIESKINISGCYAHQIQYVKKEKTMHGVIAVEKKKLGEHYIHYFNNDYTLLEGQMQRYSFTTKSVREVTNDLKRFRVRKDNLSYYVTVISISGVQVPENFNTQISRIDELLSEIESGLDNSNIEESIKLAESYFEQAQYAKALAVYEVVNIKLPDDKRVLNGIKETKLKLEQQYVINAHNYQTNGDYDLAVLEYDKLFIKIPGVKYKYTREYNQIEKVAFDRFAEELDYAIQNMTLAEAQAALQKLNKYQFVDQKKYNKYYQKVKELNANKLFEKAEVEYHDKRYSASINTVKSARIYSHDNKFIRLKNQSINQLYKLEVEEFKFTQPHVFAFQIGGGLQTQNSLWAQHQQTDQYDVLYIPSFTTGFFWTYGKHVHVKSSGKDKSRKNLLGIKYTYVFQQEKTNVSDLNEVELVVGFSRYFLFNIGVSTFRIDPNVANTKIEAFSSAIILRWYMHPLEVQFEFKTYMDSDAKFYPLLKASMVIHAKMKRKITAHDKKRIKLEVENEYK